MSTPPTPLAVERVITAYEKKVYNPVLRMLARLPNDQLEAMIHDLHIALRAYYREAIQANDQDRGSRRVSGDAD